MIEEDLLLKSVQTALDLGASYADARFQTYDYELVRVENKRLKSYSSRTQSGIGIRVLINGAWGSSSVSLFSKEALDEAVRSAVKMAKAAKRMVKEVKLAEFKAVQAKAKSEYKLNPLDIPPEEKVSLALDANKFAWVRDEVKNADTRLGLSVDKRLFISSEGARVEIETVLTGLSHGSVAKANGIMEGVFHQESRVSGFEFVQRFDWGEFVKDLSNLAVEAAKAKVPPPGTYPVVVDPELVGLLLHEAFGHASEGDLVASGESVLVGKVGERVASELVTVVDEGIVNGGYYHPFDDEGVPKIKTTVVDEGVLKGYLHSRETAAKFGVNPTGNGRAQDFENSPIVRQTNYYVKPGDHSFDELLEGIDHGFYIKGKGSTGGQVDVGVGTFTFNVGPSYVIKNGRLEGLVRGVVISGMILETLKGVDAIGKDLEIHTSVFGGCGKNAQMVRVGDGGPHMRVLKMVIGGR